MTHIRNFKQGEAFQWLKNLIKKPPKKKCVVWPFNMDKRGYGWIYHEGRCWSPSRLCLVLVTGKDPKNKYVAHKPIECHNPSCVNPNHLRWATPKENCADRLLDGTFRGKGNSKLNERKVIEIFHAEGSCSEIGRLFNVSKMTVSSIKREKSWAWVDKSK